MIRLALLCFIATATAQAQLIGGGIKFGAPLTEAKVAFNPSNAFESDASYVLGPQFELRLPAGFAIEFNALYTNLKLQPTSLAATALGLNAFDADSWEFPLLGKKKFGSGALRPFVGIGASFRRLTNVKNIGSFIVGSDASSNPDDYEGRNSTGFVIGAGLEIRALFIRLSPEIRFTRWGTKSLGEGVRNVFRLNENQGQVLIGISF
jgi:opacity protein-like surface antigen